MVARDRHELRFAAVIVAAGILTGIVYNIQLWTLNANGFSELSLRLPYWDFSNLWAGGKLALEGHVLDLFDADAYRLALRNMFGMSLPNQEWSYPPSLLLLGIPLALLPIGSAYLLWTLGTLLLLYFALRPLGFPWYVRLLLLVSPAACMNVIFGQNGALTAALLIGGLALAPTRPVFAGVLLGLLTIKPHLGILVPICLLASGNYRAVLSAGVTTITLMIVTGLFFGFEVWPLFFQKTGPLMAEIMEAPYPQPYHKNAITAFIMARGLGFDVLGAYVIQGVFLVLAGIAVFLLWTPRSQINHARRVCITGMLSIVATPYGYSYDVFPLCIAVAFLFMNELRFNRWPLAIAYLWPLFLHTLNDQGIGLSILAPVSLVVVAMYYFLSDEVKGSASSEPAKAS